MFGRNPIRKFEPSLGLELRIQDIFHTLQGEGPFAGTPAVFLRVAGCNLRCHFCDTDFESRYDSGLMPLADIVERINEVAGDYTDLVVVTGGEPFRQNLVPLLLELTQRQHFHVQIETAGTLFDPCFHEFGGWILQPLQTVEVGGASIVVSPKTPRVHPRIAQLACAWKYIIEAQETSPEDGLPVRSTQVKGKMSDIARPAYHVRPSQIFVQPMDVPDPERRERNVQECVRIALQFGYRLSLQQHKLVGLP